MYDINTKNVKKGKKLYFIFLAAGLLFLIIFGGIIISNYIKLNSLDMKTTSTKVEVESYEDDEGDTLYSPTYYYRINGVQYSCTSSSSSSINPGSSNKTVYYSSKDPSKCMTEYSKSSNRLLLFLMIIPIVFIVVAVFNMRKVSKRVKLINELNQNGKLVKNMPYHLENTNMTVNDIPIMRPVVEYALSTGSIITLYDDPRFDGKQFDADGMVDLVIDENNPENYFIDFEINRLTGNLPSDYYHNTQNNNGSPTQLNTKNQNSFGNNLNMSAQSPISDVSNTQQSQTVFNQNQIQPEMKATWNRDSSQQSDINKNSNEVSNMNH